MREDITIGVLLDMSSDDLQAIGVTAFGYRHKISKKAKELALSRSTGYHYFDGRSMQFAVSSFLPHAVDMISACTAEDIAIASSDKNTMACSSTTNRNSDSSTEMSDSPTAANRSSETVCFKLCVCVCVSK